jgi:hypothetical protein
LRKETLLSEASLKFEVYYAQNPIPEASVAFIYREQYRCEHKDHAHDFLSNSELRESFGLRRPQQLRAADLGFRLWV